MAIVYADNNATTMVAPEVAAAMAEFFTTSYFNPSSMYEAAQGPAHAVTAARASLARLLGAAHPDEILFTSCASESNNTAVFGVVKALPSRRHVITTAVEHPAVLNVCKVLARDGFDVTILPVDHHGRLDVADFVRAIRPDTALVSVMHANNETGVVFPVGELARIAKETDPGIVVHSDATQTVGKLAIDLGAELKHVDLLSFSGHKLHAPKGVGALFVRRGTPCKPLLIGGHQENGRRAGTENVAFIVGLAKALQLAMETHRRDDVRVTALRDRLERDLAARIPLVQVNGAEAPRLGNTSNVSVHFIEGEGMLYELSSQEICASSGSACTSGSLEPSHVLRAMKVPFTAAHGSIRFSFSRYTTEDEVDRIIAVFPTIVDNLRRLSPYWDPRTNAPRSDAEAMLREAVK